jgi:autotransporter-associated beta strand protein
MAGRALLVSLLTVSSPAAAVLWVGNATNPACLGDLPSPTGWLTQTNWCNGTLRVAWNNSVTTPDSAVFGSGTGTNGFIQIGGDSTVNCSNITFNAAGGTANYLLQPFFDTNKLNFVGSPTITVGNNQHPTIQYGITGTGFTVAGQGTLTLAPQTAGQLGSWTGPLIINSSISGGLTLSAGALGPAVPGTCPLVLVQGGFLTFNNSNPQLGTNCTLDVEAAFAQLSSSGNQTVNQLILGNGGSISGSGETLTSTLPYDLRSGSVFSVLAGTAGINKTTTGTVTLTANNTVTGPILITGGSLIVNGSTAAGSSVTVSNGGTLGGFGTVRGPVIIGTGGILSPGNNSIVRMTFPGTVTVTDGTIFMEVNRTNSMTSDQIVVSNALTFGGTLVISNRGPALAAGDTFSIFSAGSYAGYFSHYSLPSLSRPLFWDTSKLAVNGTISVNTNTTPPTFFDVFATFPPTNSVYVTPYSPTIAHPQNVVVGDLRFHLFSQLAPLPPLGGSSPATFTSQLDFNFSTNGGITYAPLSATVQNSAIIIHSQDTGGVSFYDLTLTQFDFTAPGVMGRISQTLPSNGEETVTPIPGGYTINSFFDVFTELSIDGGNTWLPALGPAHLEGRPDPWWVPPTEEPTPLLPPPNDGYDASIAAHAQFPAGFVLKDVRHRLFTMSQPPPAPGATNLENFNSILDFNLSTDGGNTFQFVRSNALVQVQVVGIGSTNRPLFDVTMLSLSAALPGGGLIRASQSQPTRGVTQIDPQPNGLHRINSFFDVFTELSLDGGTTWQAPSNGPVRMQLEPQAPEVPTTAATLPVTNSPYISPALWHAIYAQGIVISNVTHRSFTASLAMPSPGATNTESFGSAVDMLISQDGGHTFTPATANANVSVQIVSRTNLDNGNTRFFDTTMQTLDLSGGSLPAGIKLRLSPTLPTLGKTSVRSDASGAYHISSFFDVFTELSTDNGSTWSPSTNAPALMSPRLPAHKRSFVTSGIPPTNSYYISAAQWHALFANGTVISNVTHGQFAATFLPPPARSTNTDNFNSRVSFLLSLGSNQPFIPVTANATSSVSVANSGFQGAEQVFQNQMLGLNLSGGSMPAGMMIRVSPTHPSVGETHLTAPLGGQPNYHISSFFDIFTQISTDNGATWSPANSPGYMELHIDPGIPPVTINQPQVKSNVASFTLQSQPGLQYILQYKDNLTDFNWSPLYTTPGTGQTLTFTNPLPPALQHRFFRIQVQEANSQ